MSTQGTWDMSWRWYQASTFEKSAGLAPRLLRCWSWKHLSIQPEPERSVMLSNCWKCWRTRWFSPTSAESNIPSDTSCWKLAKAPSNWVLLNMSFKLQCTTFLFVSSFLLPSVTSVQKSFHRTPGFPLGCWVAKNCNWPKDQEDPPVWNAGKVNRGHKLHQLTLLFLCEKSHESVKIDYVLSPVMHNHQQTDTALKNGTALKNVVPPIHAKQYNITILQTWNDLPTFISRRTSGDWQLWRTSRLL